MADKRRTFESAALEAAFAEQGYVVVPGLERPEVEALTEFFWTQLAALSTAERTVAWGAPFEHRKAENARILRAVEPKLGHLFADHRMLFGHFISCWPTQDGVPLHQDWTTVDETRFRAVNFWLPLTDLEGQTSKMCVLPGGHRHGLTWRSDNVHTDVEPLWPDLRAQMVDVIVEPGQAVLFSTELLHASSRNESERPRINVTGLAVPREAQLYYAAGPEDAQRRPRLIEIDDDWYLRYHQTEGGLELEWSGTDAYLARLRAAYLESAV